ncbi:hypothetical protein ACRAWD_30270 [Caulobacter segnis]
MFAELCPYLIGTWADVPRRHARAQRSTPATGTTSTSCARSASTPTSTPTRCGLSTSTRWPISPGWGPGSARAGAPTLIGRVRHPLRPQSRRGLLEAWARGKRRSTSGAPRPGPCR